MYFTAASLVSLLTLCASAVGLDSPLHFVLLPNAIRLETEEVITLTSLEASSDVSFRLCFMDYPERKKVYSERNVTVPQGEIANVTLLMRLSDVPKDKPTPLLVVVSVETIGYTPPFKKETTLLVNESPGYIFIQTDKPLYTPDQTVLIRLVTLNERFRPVTWPVQVDIQNPEGMIISRQVLDNTAMMTTDQLKIPENPVLGNWTVTAKFANGFKTTSAVRFEVKEYVLPTFAVSFSIPEDQRVVLPNHTHFRMVVGARYMYGKPVKGHVTVTFGLLWHGHVFQVGKLRNMQLNNTGHTECQIAIEELKLPVKSVWFPNGGKLHVQATVTETASGRVQKADDVSVVFSDHLYVVKFTRSSRFFKPGLPYVLQIEVHKANGEPGAQVPLDIECKEETTPGQVMTLVQPTKWGSGSQTLTSDGRGKLWVEYVVPREAKRLLFKVWPRFLSSAEAESSKYLFQAVPFFSPSTLYMHLQLVLTDPRKRGSMPKVGDYVSVTTQYTSAEHIKTVNLVILSQGQIVWQARTRNLQGNFTTFHVQLTQEMSPGARVVAFTVPQGHGRSEVVSDSVWVDVQGQCEGELTMTRVEDGKKTMRPGDIGTVTLSGPPHTLVGVVAVDNAVYNLKNRSLTRESVFDAMRTHDRGCGWGGGRGTDMVFQNAGLAVVTSADLHVSSKVAEGCVDKTVRRKRSTKSREHVKATCCLEGARVENGTLALCFHISQQLKLTLGGSALCAREFFTCCRGVLMGRYSFDPAGRLVTMGDRGNAGMEFTFDDNGDEDDVTVNIADIPLRTNFPESWWFEEYNLGPKGEANVDFVLPDSITSWSVQAIGVSMGAGLCVAPPLQLTSFSSFFVQLDLPYSVVRLEQLEVRATVYNYMSRKLRVRLMLQSVDGVCTSGQPRKTTEMVRLELGPHDAASAFFPIVPLEIGQFPIRVMAFSAWGRDAVEKTLRVVGEGLEMVQTVSVLLDPSGKRFLRNRHANSSFSVKNEVRVAEKRQSVEFDLDLPQEVIPDTDSCTLHAMGDLLGPTLQVLIEGVSELLRMPTGCGEQNLIYLAPNVFVTRYLRATRRLSAHLEKKARTLIRQGVVRQMTFRKPDASYGTWPHAESSTWLTAFAMKTLCQAEHYVTVDHKQVCSSVAWVRLQQNTDGSFREGAWVTHREMLGGVNGDVSHAAFILIGLLECECDNEGSREVKERAVRFIERHVSKTDRPLALAISAYALTLAGSPSSDLLVKRLLTMAKSDNEGHTYWDHGTEREFANHTKPYWYAKKPGALAVEVTSYALLTFLARGDLKMGTNIVSWLLQQRNSHGAFISTQDTVVGLQALSEYSIKSYTAILDMTCHIRSEVDTRFRKSISLTPEDAMVLKSVPQVPTGGKLHLEAKGTGVGLMQVEVRFNVPEMLDECKFEVKVETFQHNSLLQSFFWNKDKPKCEPCSLECDEEEDEHKDEEEEEDFENFTFPPIVPRIQTQWRRQQGKGDHSDTNSWEEEVNENESSNGPSHVLFSKIGRPKRSARPYSANVVCVEVCVRFLGNRTTGMSVVDVGLFTGYLPVEEDLNALKMNGKIDFYEQSQRSVVLYVEEISHKESTCLKFRARQEHMAHNIQPAQVQVFDYYNPDDRCTVFYKSDNRSGQLVNFCDHQKQICQCLESRCAKCEESWYGLRWMDMTRFACTNATYVLEMKALDRDLEKAGFERLLGQIVSVVSQRGRHVLKEGDKVILLKRSSCYCPRVSPGNTYIMMLQQPKRFKDADGNAIFAFLLDKSVFVVENYKPKQKGLNRLQRATARNLRRTQRRLRRRGCTRGSRARGKGNNRRRNRKGKNSKKTKRKIKL